MLGDEIILLNDIVLEQMRKSDIPALIQSINDPLIAANTLSIPFPYTKKDGQAYYQKIAEKRKELGFPCEWLVKKGDEVLGAVGLLGQEGPSSHRTEIGYWMTPAARGRGIMSQVIAAVSEYAFRLLQFKRLEAHTFCYNIASQKVLENNGFIREGRHRSYLLKDNNYKDVYAYSKLHPSLEIN